MTSVDMLNLVAVSISVIAVLTSSYLAAQTLRSNKTANHVPVLIDFFKEHREPAFVERERRVWEHLGDHDPALGFSRLPPGVKEDTLEVSLFYLMMSYFSEYNVADPEMLALQVQYRLLLTWDAIQPFVDGERVLRGGTYTFLNTLEVFVERARRIDNEAIAKRMFARLGIDA